MLARASARSLAHLISYIAPDRGHCGDQMLTPRVNVGPLHLIASHHVERRRSGEDEAGNSVRRSPDHYDADIANSCMAAP
jgi:hypothetical protein